MIDDRDPEHAPLDSVVPLSGLLNRWVAEEAITVDHAAQLARTTGPLVRTVGSEQAGSSHSLAVEAVGYPGGAIVAGASILIAARYWDDLDSAWRLGVLGAATLGLLGCDAAVPTGPAGVGDRLRAVLRLGSTVVGAAVWMGRGRGETPGSPAARTLPTPPVMATQRDVRPGADRRTVT